MIISICKPSPVRRCFFLLLCVLSAAGAWLRLLTMIFLLKDISATPMTIPKSSALWKRLSGKKAFLCQDGCRTYFLRAGLSEAWHGVEMQLSTLYFLPSLRMNLIIIWHWSSSFRQKTVFRISSWYHNNLIALIQLSDAKLLMNRSWRNISKFLLVRRITFLYFSLLSNGTAADLLQQTERWIFHDGKIPPPYLVRTGRFLFKMAGGYQLLTLQATAIPWIDFNPPPFWDVATARGDLIRNHE